MPLQRSRYDGIIIVSTMQQCIINNINKSKPEICSKQSIQAFKSLLSYVKFLNFKIIKLLSNFILCSKTEMQTSLTKNFLPAPGFCVIFS